jgi:hypothetical protein
MRPMTLAVLLSLACLHASRADEATTLGPFLDDRTFAVLRLDLRKFDVEKLAETIAPKAKPPKELAAFIEVLARDGRGVLYVVASLADLPDEYPFLLVPTDRSAPLGSLTNRLGALQKFERTLQVSRLGDTLLVGGPKTLKRLQSLKPTARPDLLKALASGERLGRLVVVPTTDARRVLDETLPTLPDELGGGSVKPLSRGLRWIVANLDVSPKLNATFTVQTADADAAKAIESLLSKVMAMPELAKLAALWKPKRDDTRLTVTLDEKTLIDLVRPHIERFVVTEQQERANGQMRRLLAAMHDHEAKHGAFPAHCSFDKEGKPLLSWRVHLLPSLGYPKLYKEFKLDEPWDSNHNKALLARMPAVFRPASDRLAGQHRTTWLVPLGEDTMFPPKRGVRVTEIADGMKHTILLVDAADEAAVEWTRPVDLKVEEKDPRKGLSTRHSGQVHVGTADGTVHFLPATFGTFSLWALFTRAGGEVVELP